MWLNFIIIYQTTCLLSNSEIVLLIHRNLSTHPYLSWPTQWFPLLLVSRSLDYNHYWCQHYLNPVVLKYGGFGHSVRDLKLHGIELIRSRKQAIGSITTNISYSFFVYKRKKMKYVRTCVYKIRIWKICQLLPFDTAIHSKSCSKYISCLFWSRMEMKPYAVYVFYVFVYMEMKCCSCILRIF